MPKIFPITIKKEGVSDEFYTINELYKTNGSQVFKGDLIFCFETSKTSIDIESIYDGFIFYFVKENDEVKIGDVIAIISSEENFSTEEWLKNNQNKNKLGKVDTNSNVKISKPAQRLIKENNLDVTVFNDFSLVTKQDVEDYMAKSIKKLQSFNSLNIDKNSIVIYGGGGHARMCIEIIKQTKSHQIIGIIDDNISCETKILGIPVLGKSEILKELITKGLQNIILGIGGALQKGLRQKIYSNLKQSKLKIPNIIHPSASIEPSVSIGEGNQIMQGAIIGSNVIIGNNCIINSGSIIAHDTIIGNNVHIAPGAILGGGVTINNNTVIGMGCTIFLGLTIGEDIVIQNGTHIFNNILKNTDLKFNK